MEFLSKEPAFRPLRPMMALVLANTVLSTVPGISGAGPTPEKTLLTPVLDAELVATGSITSLPVKPNTPTGCPTPATITRSMMALTSLQPVFVNAGLTHPPTVPCLDVYGESGGDPRRGDAVPRAEELYRSGVWAGRGMSQYTDLLVLGECVPGGTTTALCVLRAMGYEASVSSSFIDNPVTIKEAVVSQVLDRIGTKRPLSPMDAVRSCGDPMIAVAAGIASGYEGEIVLAGGTQMLAVAAVLKGLGVRVPAVATTVYVRDDHSASFTRTLREIGGDAYYLDPNFSQIGHTGLARYCIGEVKEGMGAGGAMLLAYLMGYSPEEITRAVFDFVVTYG